MRVCDLDTLPHVPRLQCKCMRVLQFFPLPEKESELTLLTTIVKSTIESSECAPAQAAAPQLQDSGLSGLQHVTPATCELWCMNRKLRASATLSQPPSGKSTALLHLHA